MGLSADRFERQEVQKRLWLLAPKTKACFRIWKKKVRLLSQAENLIWLTAGHSQLLDAVGSETWQIPLKTYIEKAGSFTNFQGKVQGFKVGTTIVPQALTLSEAIDLMAGREIDWNLRPKGLGGPKVNYANAHRGNL
ncbi:MAG: hypothetical protein HC883_01890 [Bdellovibrionaceae bacterium]|nr:hypothetical protein [Pseudobdellovibrionaceae bacterium]